jgi:hypothetical protein
MGGRTDGCPLQVVLLTAQTAVPLSRLKPMDADGLMWPSEEDIWSRARDPDSSTGHSFPVWQPCTGS